MGMDVIQLKVTATLYILVFKSNGVVLYSICILHEEAADTLPFVSSMIKSTGQANKNVIPHNLCSNNMNSFFNNLK
jgi:hypothetical protein